MYLELNIPNNLLNELKEFGKNQNEIIMEAIKFYIKQQKSKKIYNEFENACIELKNKECKNLDELINELENS